MKSLGIDLAGKSDNPTGFTFLENGKYNIDILYEDEVILHKVKSSEPDIVAIDAPFSFSEDGGFRRSDYILVSRGYRVLPPDLGGMKSLTERGIRLSRRISDLGFEVIEVHPRTSARIIFGSNSREDWKKKLERKAGISRDMNEHELDSVLAAITGKLYLGGDFEEVGDEGKVIVIPESRIEGF